MESEDGRVAARPSKRKLSLETVINTINILSRLIEARIEPRLFARLEPFDTAKACAIGAFVVLLSIPAIGYGFESDVHYGLTKWLASEAGFDEGEAEAIALGDQRVDGGLIENMKSPLQYACLAPYVEDAADIQMLHYPSPVSVPAPAEQRAVVAGGPAASGLAERLIASAVGKAGFMLQLFGRSLHPLQDSWANQGTPNTIVADFFVCDQRLSMGSPTTESAARIYRAGMTGYRTGDVTAMAHDTYNYLLRYPQVEHQIRHPAAWATIEPELSSFSVANTKAMKAVWFNRHGLADVSFLDGTRFPDGAGWKPQRWTGRKLPALETSVSSQTGIDPALLGFYNEFFSAWLTGPATAKSLAKFLSSESTVPAHGSKKYPALSEALELELASWRLRDQGTAISLMDDIHSKKPHGSDRLKAVIGSKGSVEQFETVAKGVLPILKEGFAPSPLLPFVIYSIKQSDGQSVEAIALAKLVDAPYETVGIVAERSNDQWYVVKITSSLDY